MVNFDRFALSRAVVVAALHATSVCAGGGDMSLGEQFDVKIDLTLTGCDYELAFSFRHDASLPLGPSINKSLCAPGSIAPDGLPYLASRDFYFPFSDKIYRETGFAGVGNDYQVCGHPPQDVFTLVEHYDMHFYRFPMEVRDGWSCELVPEAPICNPNAQSTDSGRAFFNVGHVYGATVGSGSKKRMIVSNMPVDFECDLFAALPAMGTHCHNFLTEPTSDTWVDPVLIMGAYDGDIAFYEPMVPLDHITGPVDSFYREETLLQGKTISTLPYEYSVDYVAATERATATLKGKRSGCSA